MIISVPMLWNCCQSSLFSSLASTSPGKVGCGGGGGGIKCPAKLGSRPHRGSVVDTLG